MKHLRRLYLGQKIIAVALLLYLAIAAIPLNWMWFTPGEFVIADAEAGKMPVIGFSRVIQRPVMISYSVTVRRAANLKTVCQVTSAPFEYLPNAQLPEGDNLNLSWWTDGDPDCQNLQPDTYSIHTCWTGYGLLWGVKPPATVCVDRQPFRVVERPVSVDTLIVIEDDPAGE